jgi:hypothetical protein
MLSCIDKETGKTITEYRIPEKKQNDLVFSLNQVDNPRSEILYVNSSVIFNLVNLVK